MRSFSFLFGLILCLMGVAGFTQPWITNHHVGRIFEMNSYLSALHLSTGALAFLFGAIGKRSATYYLRFLGLLYALLAILGFIYGEHKIFDLFANNRPDTWFHVIIGIGALITGFGSKEKR